MTKLIKATVILDDGSWYSIKEESIPLLMSRLGKDLKKENVAQVNIINSDFR